MRNVLRVVLVLAVLVTAFGAGVAPAAAQGSGGFWYVVQVGDYLGRIAVTYGTTVQAIVAANGIYNPSRIYPGQQLWIPYGYYNPPPQYPPVGRTHVVQYGENLFRIALYYGTTVEALAAANGIWNINRVYAGQVLRIPVYHVVRYGETLASIAWAYGTTVAAIASANGIWNVNYIYVGQTLVIP
ncbi:MAG: LysM peptidoglycan-binding domain-containing protein [Anaerolineae bacterium]|nr:LysM peptidoglycan-binding domain-containing protein [Anaerolineae bacterium]